jgi:hypothetical protein
MGEEKTNVGSEILTVVITKSSIFWDIEQGILFAAGFLLDSCMAYFSHLKIEAFLLFLLGET